MAAAHAAVQLNFICQRALHRKLQTDFNPAGTEPSKFAEMTAAMQTDGAGTNRASADFPPEPTQVAKPKHRYDSTIDARRE